MGSKSKLKFCLLVFAKLNLLRATLLVSFRSQCTSQRVTWEGQGISQLFFNFSMKISKKRGHMAENDSCSIKEVKNEKFSGIDFTVRLHLLLGCYEVYVDCIWWILGRCGFQNGLISVQGYGVKNEGSRSVKIEIHIAVSTQISSSFCFQTCKAQIKPAESGVKLWCCGWPQSEWQWMHLYR